MSVDVFGRSLPDTVNRELLKAPPGIGFSLNEAGNFDIEKKRLCNVANAVEKRDAVNLNELETKIAQTDEIIKGFEERVKNSVKSSKRY